MTVVPPEQRAATGEGKNRRSAISQRRQEAVAKPIAILRGTEGRILLPPPARPMRTCGGIIGRFHQRTGAFATGSPIAQPPGVLHPSAAGSEAGNADFPVYLCARVIRLGPSQS
jgi:hypothetical protein